MIWIRSVRDVADSSGDVASSPEPLLVSPSAIRESADLVIGNIQGAMRGIDAYVDIIDDWERLCGARKIEWAPVYAPGKRLGFFQYSHELELGVLTVNTAYPEPIQCWSAAHEMSHYEVETWEPVRLRLGADIWRYDDQRLRVSEAIANLVAEGITGLSPDVAGIATFDLRRG